MQQAAMGINRNMMPRYIVFKGRLWWQTMVGALLTAQKGEHFLFPWFNGSLNFQWDRMYTSKQIISLPSYCERGFCMYDRMGGDL